MERAFASAGAGVALQLVGDGRAAIDYLAGAGSYCDRKEYPVPAVVLLDLNMPEVNGFEVLRWIRAHPEYAAMPVVVFSSSAKLEDRARSRELGATEYWEKPATGLKFGAVVEKLKEKWLGGEESDQKVDG